MSKHVHAAGLPRRRATPWLGVLGLALGCYAVAGLTNLQLPGLYYDEALDAVPAMQFLLGQPLNTEATVELLGREWPLMLMRYVGSTTTYLSMAAFSLFGISATVLRLLNWSLGLAALLLSWGFLREYLDERVAALAVLLLALNPTFVFWSRMGAFVSFPMLPLAIASLWALWRWHRRGATSALIVAILCLGAGLTTKLLFLWYWIGLGLGFLSLKAWLHPPRGWQSWLTPPHNRTLRVWLFAGLSLLLTTAPLVIYNLRDWGTFRFVLADVMPGEAARTGLLDALAQLPAIVSRDFGNLLRGTWFNDRLGVQHANDVAVPVFVIAAGIVLVLALRRRLRYSARRVALLVILMISVTMQSAATSMGQGADHLLIVWPIPQVIVATAVFGLLDLIQAIGSRQVDRRVARDLVVFAAVIVVAAEGWTTASYHRTLAYSGGHGAFSDAIYELAIDLDQQDARRVIALDWGFARSIQLLTAGRVSPEEWFTYGPAPGDAFEGYVSQLIARGPALYLFHTPPYTAFGGHWEKFSLVAYRHRLTPVLHKSYTQRDGTPVSQVYGLEPTPRRYALPGSATALDVTLGDTLAFAGYEVTPGSLRAGDDLEIKLYWKALRLSDRTYKVFVHLLDADGNLIAQHDSQPNYGAYPMTEWQAGEVVMDWITLGLGESAVPGRCYLFTGMYDADTGQRLVLRRAGVRLQGDTIEFGQVDVEAHLTEKHWDGMVIRRLSWSTIRSATREAVL